MALVTMRCHAPGMTTAAAYAEFAARETHGVSPAYERLLVAVSRDDEVLALLSTLPPTLYQVPPHRREAFARVVRELPGHWISNEDPDALAYDTLPAPPDGALRNVLALDGTPLAWTRSHGQAIIWFGTAGMPARTDVQAR
jgi:hypothetical protein